MMRCKIWLLAGLFSLCSAVVLADSTPVGVWKTIDDATHQPKALVEISQAADGQLSGKVIKLLQHPDAVCEAEGAQKGKPILGMTILWGLKPDGDGWDGGKIMDPKSGKIYSAKMSFMDGDKKLKVRGFIGFSLLGRTQIWERQ